MYVCIYSVLQITEFEILVTRYGAKYSNAQMQLYGQARVHASKALKDC